MQVRYPIGFDLFRTAVWLILECFLADFGLTVFDFHAASEEGSKIRPTCDYKCYKCYQWCGYRCAV